MTQFINKKLVIVSVIIIFLGISLLFRDRISSFLTFRTETPPQTVEEKKNNPREEEVKELVSSELPAYKGADPAQIRPDPDEVKLFAEDQKEKIYSQIRTNAAAIKENPNFFAGWLEIGLLKKVIGDYSGARDAWEYASLIRPKNSISFANLGELYWHYLPDYPRAENNFRKSLQNNSTDADIYISLAELYHYSMPDKANEAPKVLLEGLNVNPGNDVLTRRLTYLYEQRGEYNLAIEWWGKVLIANPTDSSIAEKIEKLKAK